MAVDTFDLLTVQELADDAYKSFSIDLVNNFPVETERVIGDITELVQEFLDRGLIVRDVTIFPQEWEWEANPAKGKFELIVKDYPIVEVKTEGAMKAIDSERKIDANSRLNKIRYFGGYRREDQTLTNLQAEHSDLTTLPKILHRGIRRCAVALTIYEIGRALAQTYGRSTQQMNTGDVNVVINRERDDVYRSELRKIETQKILT